MKSKEHGAPTQPTPNSTVGHLVYQQRYSGMLGVDDWQTISADEYRSLAEAPLTERRVLQVVEHDMIHAGYQPD
jgi:hypothetical protein